MWGMYHFGVRKYYRGMNLKTAVAFILGLTKQRCPPWEVHETFTRMKQMKEGRDLRLLRQGQRLKIKQRQESPLLNQTHTVNKKGTVQTTYRESVGKKVLNSSSHLLPFCDELRPMNGKPILVQP